MPVVLPVAGSPFRTGPLLSWKAVAKASYYNVVVTRSGKRVATGWPLGLQWRAPRHLKPGLYRWYVWPGFGPKDRARYGHLIGTASFRVTAGLTRPRVRTTERSSSDRVLRMSQDAVIDAAATGARPAHPLYERHRELLERALQAIRERTYWSAYPEHPEGLRRGGAAAGPGRLRGLPERRFPLEQPATDGWVGAERSPFGIDLGVSYPHADLDALLPAMQAAIPAWRDAGPDTRAGVCLEILARLNARSFEIAHAVHAHHRPGLRDGLPGRRAARPGPGPRGGRLRLRRDDPARPRGALGEAAGQAAAAAPAQALHRRPAGDRPGRRLQHLPDLERLPGPVRQPGRPATRCWSSRSRAPILPLAITVAVAREVLAEAGFSPDLVCLAVEAPGERLAATLAVRPEIRIVDYTGSTAFGEWLEANARQAVVYTEKAGVNPVVIDSTGEYRAMLANLAFTLSLYSGQMCTTTAEPVRAARRDRHRRGPQDASTRSPRTSARRSTGCSATTAGRPRSSARSGRTDMLEPDRRRRAHGRVVRGVARRRAPGLPGRAWCAPRR